MLSSTSIAAIVAVFLLPLISVISTVVNSEQGKRCGNVQLSDMVEFAFVSDETDEQIVLRKTPERKDFGLVSDVFIGYFANKNGISNSTFSPANCVAIKLTPLHQELAYLNSIRNVRKIRETLPNSKRRSLIIEVLAFGKRADAFVTVMELGDGNYEQLYKVQNFTAREMSEQIEQLVKPLVQFHEVAIHLDLKRANYVFINDPEDGKRRQLKLIDFDLGVLLPESLVDKAQLTNAQMRPKWPYRYNNNGPEYGERPNEVKVTTKTDIWTIGIMIYELYLLQPQHHLDPVRQADLLTKIAEIYRGFRWMPKSNTNNEQKKTPDSLEVEIPYHLDFRGQKWLTEYADALGHIFELRAKLPRIFLLIMNILQTEGQWRMSAAGIIEFLAGKCRPPFASIDEGNISDEQQIPLFSHEETSTGKLSVKLLGKQALMEVKATVGKKFAQGNVKMRNMLRGMKRLKAMCAH